MSSKKTTRKKKKIGLDHVNYLWGLVCSMSSIDQQKNNISLFNVINQLNIKKEDFHKGSEFLVPVQHEVVVVLRRSLRQGLCTNKIVVDTKISLIDPENKVLRETIVPVPFDSGKRVMRFRIQLLDFKLSTEGDYCYKVEIRQPDKEVMELKGVLPFEVLAV